MKWCRFHLRWEIWQGDKLVAWTWGSADEVQKRELYARVASLILDGYEFYGLEHQLHDIA